jgi:phosphotransferase system HPr (HPr) family protein
MSDKSVTIDVFIVNPQGIHLRPADLFAKLANQFKADIQIVKGSEQFDAKSVLSLLTLAAVQGTQLTLKATGEDADTALAALADLVAQGFGEMDHPPDGN